MLGVLVDLPLVPHRPVCLLVLARLWRPGHTPGRLDLAVDLVKVVCGHLGTRRVDLTCDGAYAGRQLRDLPAQVTVCCRLRADAALHRLAPPRRPGTRGRPRTRGDRLPELTTLAGMVTTPFALHRVARYGQGGLAAVACFACLWPAVFATRPVNVVLVRAPDAPDGLDLALVTTDLAATPAELVHRYATRWQVEVCFRQDAGVGQARNRVRLAVERTVPFGLVRNSLAIAGTPTRPPPRRGCHPPRAGTVVPDQGHPVSGRHARQAPPGAHRAQYRPSQLSAPTIAEILEVQAAWAAAGA